ncbi:SGT1 protein-domain-containing protein [Spinellus fusiger]|nr:SGT1 protein-domain-containing protein [Spinellus fusiger]
METLQDVFQMSSSREVDYVQYSIYFPPKEDTEKTLDMLQVTCALVHSQLQGYLDGYLWQKDRFNLSIAYDEKQDPPYPFLHGVTRFGDCISDEWFIVFLLYEISTQHPEALITVTDNDGDVLLIEAAMELPSWLDPSNSENRVYIHKAKLHIVPLPNTPADILQLPNAGKLTRTNAIFIVREDTVVTEAAEDIQIILRGRIHDYPQAAKDETHYARCLLPKQAAYALLDTPELLPLAVEAFYLRDPASLKACTTMTHFPPQQGDVDTVLRFTRTTYAQTVSQKFYAPKPFRLPPISQKREYAAAELGMKITCGLEMLYAKKHVQDDDAMESYHFDTDADWKGFSSHLNRLGYYRDEKEGSRLYRRLEKQAKEQFLQSKHKVYSIVSEEGEEDVDFSCGSVFGQSSPKQVMDELLQKYSDERLEELMSQKKEEDSSDWINVDPKQLETMLEEKMGKMNDKIVEDLKHTMGEELGDEEMGVDLQKMMSQFECFVEGSRSGVDGVEFPGENDQQEGESDEESDNDEEDPNQSISFNADNFLRILRNNFDTISTITEIEEEKTEEKEDEFQEMKNIMEEMDMEIREHDKINSSFERNPQQVEEDENAPVDIQINLVKNILESFKSQKGLPGPAGNILRQFGVVLPADEEEEEV